MDRGRCRQDGEIERLERWQDDKGRESEIKEQEAGEAEREAERLGEKVAVCLLFPAFSPNMNAALECVMTSQTFTQSCIHSSN